MGQRHFHQDNAPIHNSILITDYLTKLDIKTVPHPPYSPDLAPCDFWLFPKLRGCCYEAIEAMKEAVTKVIDMLTREDFHGAFQKLLEQYNKCIVAWRRLLWRGLEFHVCTINKRAHSKKSVNLFNDPYIYSFNIFISSVRQWPGRPGFNPRSSHTKDFKNGTWYHLA